MRIHLIISGKVQGVWYRKSAVEVALQLGLTGWAMNRANGTVEMEAQGTPAQLEAFEAWCHQGPPLALVSGVQRRELPSDVHGENAFVILSEK